MVRKRFESGDVLEFCTESGKRGLARVLTLDDFGLLVQLSEPRSGGFNSASPIVYMNPPSTRSSWKKVGQSDVHDVLARRPSFFLGTSSTGWTVQSPKGESVISAGTVSMEEMKKRGYVHKVLWHPKRIEEWLETGKPLEWGWQL
jgi:hypothetical protein